MFVRFAHSMLLFVAVLALSSAGWSAGSTVRAEEPQYDSLVRSALAEYDAGRYEEATALFNQAHALSPNARTHRGLGLTYFELRKYVASAEHLRAALADDKRRPLTAAQRTSAQTVLTQAEGFIAHVKISFEPADATLEVDGHAVEAKDGELLLDPGTHELIARAPGYSDERRRFDAISGSSTEQLRFALQSAQPSLAATDGPALPPTAATAATDTSESGPGIAPWIVVGVGGAMLVGSAVTGLMAAGVHSDLEDSCKAKTGCGKGFESDKDKGKTLVVATNVLLVGGLVTAAAGVTWWLLSDRDSGGTEVALGCVPGSCAASVFGSF